MIAIERMRRAVLSQRYWICTHAMAEMSDDELDANDMEHVILGGRITQVFKCSHATRAARAMK